MSEWPGLLEQKRVSTNGHAHDLEEAYADCKPKSYKQNAIIRILHPDEWPSADNFGETWEVAVVHELLHLLLNEWQVEANSVVEQQQERAINALAHALVRLDGKG